MKAMRLMPQTVTWTQTLPGRTRAYEIAEIRPQVDGIIQARHFEEGSLVEASQTLFQIDPAMYKARLDLAEASLAKAEAEIGALKAKHDRFEGLVAKEAISKQEFDDVRAALASARADAAIARAQLAQAEINLAYTEVYAPITGRIGAALFTKGALVTAKQAQPLAVITVLDPIYVDLTVASEELMIMRQQFPDLNKVRASLVLGEKEIPYGHSGEVLFHDFVVAESTGAITLRSKFPNPDQILLPGLFVRASLAFDIPYAILVPQKASTRQPDGRLQVWLVGEDGTAKPHAFNAGRAIGNQWLVESGLQPGDVLIIEGLMKLQPGMAIEAQIAPQTDVATSGE